MLVKQLKANEKNPRKISAKKREELRRTMLEYGDLSGVTWNSKTGCLVGGHQRVSQIDGNTKIVIEKKYSPPTRQGTVAEGFIEVEGERFKYREVSWDKQKETKAMLAANKVGGEWDRDILSIVMTDIKFDVLNTGFDAIDLKDLNIDIPKIEMPVVDNTKIFDDERFDSDEDDDSSYIKDNPGPDSQLEKERIPSMVKDSFNKIEETTVVENKRYVIIINCPDQESKDALREKIKAEVASAKCDLI